MVFLLTRYAHLSFFKWFSFNVYYCLHFWINQNHNRLILWKWVITWRVLLWNISIFLNSTEWITVKTRAYNWSLEVLDYIKKQNTSSLMIPSEQLKPKAQFKCCDMKYGAQHIARITTSLQLLQHTAAAVVNFVNSSCKQCAQFCAHWLVVNQALMLISSTHPKEETKIIPPMTL